MNQIRNNYQSKYTSNLLARFLSLADPLFDCSDIIHTTAHVCFAFTQRFPYRLLYGASIVGDYPRSSYTLPNTANQKVLFRPEKCIHNEALTNFQCDCHATVLKRNAQSSVGLGRRLSPITQRSHITQIS